MEKSEIKTVESVVRMTKIKFQLVVQNKAKDIAQLQWESVLTVWIVLDDNDITHSVIFTGNGNHSQGVSTKTCT